MGRQKGQPHRRDYTPFRRILAAEDPPQHATSSGTGRRKGKCRGEAAPYRKPGDPKHTRARRDKNLSPESAQRLVGRRAVSLTQKVMGARRKLIKDIAAEVGVHRDYPAAAARKDAKRGTMKRQAGSGTNGRCGPTCKSRGQSTHRRRSSGRSRTGNWRCRRLSSSREGTGSRSHMSALMCAKNCWPQLSEFRSQTPRGGSQLVAGL